MVNNSWGGTVAVLRSWMAPRREALLMDEYAGYAGKAAGLTGGYGDKLMVIAAGNEGEGTGFLGHSGGCFQWADRGRA